MGSRIFLMSVPCTYGKKISLGHFLENDKKIIFLLHTGHFLENVTKIIFDPIFHQLLEKFNSTTLMIWEQHAVQ